MRSVGLSILGILACAAAAATAQEADRNTRLQAAVSGRGVAIDGDERKYREDYDDLSSGGTIDFLADDQRAEGVYATSGGSILFAEHGDAVDGMNLAIAGGRWGRYHLDTKVSLLQSYYDDSYEGSLGAAFPFTNALGRDLHTNRADVDVAASVLFGEGGLFRVRYRYDQMEGDRSLLKGSVVGAQSIYSFQSPSFQYIDRQSNEVELDGVLPAGPVRIAIDASYRNEDKDIATNEINYGPSALRDRVVFDDTFDVDVVQGGILVSATEDPRIQGHAGYRAAYVDSNGSSSQSAGTDTLSTIRSSEDTHVDSLTQSGHAGLIVRPFSDLTLRASYAVRDRDRSGDGNELRMPIAGAAQQVSNDTQKDLFSHKPRVALTYSGLPRTRVRASYSFDKTTRDLDLRSIVDGNGPAAIDRIQKTDEDIYTHRARIGARSRLTRRLSAEVGYDLLREEIDQEIRELVNEVVLGDRDRDRDRVFGKLRLRAPARTSVEVGGEWDRTKFRRTDLPGDSSTKAEGYRVGAQATSTLLDQLSTHAAIAYIDRDYTVGEDSPRDLDIFRDIEFTNRYITGSLLAAWAATSQLSLRGRYTVASASGSLDNISNRVHFDASYRPLDTFGLTAGYSFLGFDEDLWAGDDFDGHFAWARFELAF